VILLDFNNNHFFNFESDTQRQKDKYVDDAFWNDAFESRYLAKMHMGQKKCI